MMISDDSKFTIQSTMDQTMLTIGSVIQTDGGDYTCRMRGDNNAELSGTARLTVFGPSSKFRHFVYCYGCELHH